MHRPVTVSVVCDQGMRRRVVGLAGELDVAAATEVQGDVRRAFEDGIPVEIDLSDVTFMDSSGLRLLLDARQRAEQRSCEMTVTHPSGDVRRLLDLTGLTELLL